MNFNFIKVQRNDLRNRTPQTIVGPILGKFSHIAINGAEPMPDKFATLLAHAKSQGLGVLWWFCPGYWNVLDLAVRYDIKSIWSSAPRSWPNFSMQFVRERAVEHMLNVLAAHPGIDGVLLDYMRYPPDIIKQRPNLFSADDITETVTVLRAAQRQAYPNVDFIGNVGRDHGSRRKGQNWVDWLGRYLVDSVNVRCYLEPYRLANELANNVAVVDLERQSICYAPGGYGHPPDSGHPPLTQAQINQYIQIANDAGYTGNPDVFDWQHVEATNRWDMIPDLTTGPEPPDPPGPDTGLYRFEGAGFAFEGILTRLDWP